MDSVGGGGRVSGGGRVKGEGGKQEWGVPLDVFGISAEVGGVVYFVFEELERDLSFR